MTDCAGGRGRFMDCLKIQMSDSKEIAVEIRGSQESLGDSVHSMDSSPPKENGPLIEQPLPPPLQNGTPGTPPPNVGNGPSLSPTFQIVAPHQDYLHISAPTSPAQHHTRIRVHKGDSSSASSSDEDKPHVPYPKTASTPNIHANSLAVEGLNGMSGPVTRSVSASPGKRPLGMSKMEVRMRGLSGYDMATHSDSDIGKTFLFFPPSFRPKTLTIICLFYLFLQVNSFPPLLVVA
eukprot:XP_011661596.1 PREDICTED: uncharacterized protein LOC577691 [Strongylocentrotus purpuratus]